MALSGLDIYKLLPRTNCKQCGFATCLAFAMALTQKKISLDACPTVSEESKKALESASQPPIKLVTIGPAKRRFEIGNETVMYRHEQKFFHPSIIGFLLEDSLADVDIDARISAIKALSFERVGQHISADLICVSNTSCNEYAFTEAVRKVSAAECAIALYSADVAALTKALIICKEHRPLIICPEKADINAYASAAKSTQSPLAVTCRTVDEAADSTEIARRAGVDEIVINLAIGTISGRIQAATYIRRAALKKGVRALGYPMMTFTLSADPEEELAEAVGYIAKYASIIVVRNVHKDYILPLFVARQDIYTDPQKPVQVEPKIYEVGKTGPNSPVIVTTNFSITYFTVAGEVESSKVPTYIICCDAEGMSVLTAWAAEKFTAERIADMIKKCGIGEKIAHRTVILPGYVSILSGKLEEVSGWKVSVGPREASGLSAFLRSWKP